MDLRISSAVNFPIRFEEQNNVVKHNNGIVDTILAKISKTITVILNCIIFFIAIEIKFHINR